MKQFGVRFEPKEIHDVTNASTGQAEKGGTLDGVNNFKVISRGFANTGTEPIVLGPNGHRKVRQ